MASRLLSTPWRHALRGHSTLYGASRRSVSTKSCTVKILPLKTSLGVLCVAAGIGSIGFYGPGRKHEYGLLRSATAASPDEFDDLGLGDIPQQLGGPLLVDGEFDVIKTCSQSHTGHNLTTHACRLESNVPCEDFLVAGDFEDSRTRKVDWSYWEIFDGHAGYQTSRICSDFLHTFVVGNLLEPMNASLTIPELIKQAYLKLDETILEVAKSALSTTPANATHSTAVAPALSGSCALGLYFQHETSTLYTANTGDCRAVLGRWSTEASTYVPQPLSSDHTGFNASEVKRIEAEHPGETGIIDPKTGRIFGLAVVRAFGDSRWKWNDETILEAHKKFWGPKPRPNGVNKTPPYLTAEPEVTETKIIDGKRGDFVIMASDGLWDHLSNEDAVMIVNKWLEAKRSGKLGKEVYEVPKNEDTYYDERPGYGLTWRIKPEYFSYEDDNAAACLVRNAMGGKRKHLVDRLVKMEPPWSRDAHDDTSVQVIFFGDV
ncbi:phosphatase 2C-like domain-containing protein [Elsinoe ampelina]|uniref:Phosphatase 2C-like domain-containing protein n=1 Tax=Elsinoe ampelina TaxID=302913 RepID=A0A6A6G3M3_9PEZI|nr:phosphatase 2C-like domain-containing protein [Elsinoe ampelina]